MAFIRRFSKFPLTGRHFLEPTIATFHSGSLNYTAKYKDSSISPTNLNIIHGNIKNLPINVQSFIVQQATLLEPKAIHICDGSEQENSHMLQIMQQNGNVHPLTHPELRNCWLTLTDPADVARIEDRTFICTKKKRDTQPPLHKGVHSRLLRYMSPEETKSNIRERFPRCMRDRIMYVVPFAMGPPGSPLTKVGVQLTDSAYVAASMRTMTRMGAPALAALAEQRTREPQFVRAVHSVGVPRRPTIQNWLCEPERVFITHLPEKDEIYSYGSGYGGNSLLGKKCMALRIGSTIARREGGLAEHMLIIGIKTPAGRKHYVAAAFPSACGKTNLAMMRPSLPGYEITCIGDDIAWMRFGSDGRLYAINPENGFFGVAPGTSLQTNPVAMGMVYKDTLFTNVGETSDGRFFWEGLEEQVLRNASPSLKIKDWQGREWTRNSISPVAHPNARFCTPIANLPAEVRDSNWNNPRGVPIDAIIFGGRRPEGVPLVFESYSWRHGVLIGAGMRSEQTAASVLKDEKGNEIKVKQVVPDPFAMRPFFGYNFGEYLRHWLSFENSKHKRRLPRIFHVNWFRRSGEGAFLWPGFGDNVRVLDWIIQRLERADYETVGGTSRIVTPSEATSLGVDELAVRTPIGFVPRSQAINTNGLRQSIDWNELLRVDNKWWLQESRSIRNFLEEQAGRDMPSRLRKELDALDARLNNWPTIQP